MKTVIIINPDRFSRQSFPPFSFLCKALIDASYLVSCITASKKSILFNSTNFRLYSAFDTTLKPFLYGIRFVLFSFIKLIQLLVRNKNSSVLVFRSCDSLTNYISCKIFKVPLIFFVDYLPWKQGENVLLSPIVCLRLLGFFFCDKLIVSSNYNAEQIISKLPSLSKKIIVKTYTAEIYDSVESISEFRENIINKFDITSPILILSGASSAETSIRAISDFKNIILILQVSEAETNYYIGLAQALGLLDRVEFVSMQASLLSYIPAMNLVVSPGSGGYVLTALSQGIPVLVVDSKEMREWVHSDKFLYQHNNVESLKQTLSKILTDKSWKNSGLEECRPDSHSEKWSDSIIKML